MHLSGFSTRAWVVWEASRGGVATATAWPYGGWVMWQGSARGRLRRVVPQQTGDPARTCLPRDNQHHSDLQPGTECKHTVAVTQCTGTTRCLFNTGRFKITDLTASEVFTADPQTCGVMRTA